MKLTGKITLITNVSQFMGPACTEEFAKEGAILVLHDRTDARAKPALDVSLAYGREAPAAVHRAAHRLRRVLQPGPCRGGAPHQGARAAGDHPAEGDPDLLFRRLVPGDARRGHRGPGAVHLGGGGVLAALPPRRPVGYRRHPPD